MTGLHEDAPRRTRFGWAWSRPGAAGIERTEDMAWRRLRARDALRRPVDQDTALMGDRGCH